MNAIDFANYAAIDAVNWSTLKELRRSPLHYRHRLTTPRDDTRGLAMGRAVHTAVFEPDRFALDYAVYKGDIRRGKAWDAFKECHADSTILKRDEYERCIAIRDAVRGNPIAAKYLRSGRAEHMIRWQDPETGLQLKGRVDFLSDGPPALVDLKTTASIAYSHFCGTAYKLGYHCQLGLYKWGVKEALGLDLPVIVAAVESAAPHDATAFEYGEVELEAGLNEVRSLLVKLAYHRERDEWPGQYSEEQVLEFPSWATERDDENVSELGLED